MAAAVLLCCAIPSAASAQGVRVVNTTSDHTPDGCALPPAGDCTLREAVMEDAAAEIEVPVDDYTLELGELAIGRDVTIRGTGNGLARLQPASGVDSRVIVIGSDTNVELSRLQVTGGQTDAFGAGILVESGATLVVADSEVVGNTAMDGGGIWADGALTVIRSLVAFNEAQGDGDGNRGFGGGIGLESSNDPATIVNTTVTDNHAGEAPTGMGLGGGIYTERSMTLLNVSIIGNEAPPRQLPENTLRGGGLYQSFPAGSGLRTTANNVLVAKNVNGGCGGTADEFSIDSDNGLIDEPQPTCNAVGDANQIVADARLGVLDDNGGPTRTHSLLGDSKAIDSGAACPAEDQRGFVRPAGAACDIGAYEFGAAPPSDPPPATQDSGSTTQPSTQQQQQPQELPPPEAGESVNVEPKSGTVKIKLKGTSKFVELQAGQQIPLGTVIDTRSGRVTLTAAANKSGGTATADFYDGIFKVLQTAGAKPITRLVLTEKLSCPKGGKASAAAKKKRKRRLWGNGRGRFRTEGEFSSATVRGTQWLTEDRCDSTLTRVVKGSVSVRDFVKKKTVVVKAGKQYVARRRR